MKQDSLDKILACLFALAKHKGIACDDAKWITYHPKGKGANGENKGRKCLIDETTGQIIKGGPPNSAGKNIKQAFKDLKEQRKQAKAQSSSNAGQSNAAQANVQSAGLTEQRAPHAELESKQKEIEELKAQIEKLKQGLPAQHDVKIDTSLPEKIPNDVVLQNRNRSNMASVLQMQEIAKNLDYYKVGTSNDFNSGCPVVSFGSYDAKDMGKTTVLATPKGERLQVQYAVVEADSVTTSNDKSGVANEKYNSSDPNIKRAIAGNGRMTAIATSYDAYPSKAEQYKQDLIANAGEHGCDPERIKGMKNPVLVRVMQPKDVTKDIGDQTNITQGLTLNAVEQARTDVSRMKNASFETYEDGSPTVESVKSFIAGLPRNEQAGLLTKEGQPTRTAQDRLQNAMMMKGYNNDYLVRMRGQAINPEGKNIINALSNASKAFAGLEGAGEYDIRPQLNKMLDQFVQMDVKGGRDFMWHAELGESNKDTALIADIARAVANNKRSAAKLTTVFKTLGEHLQKASESKEFHSMQGGLGFGLVDMSKEIRSPNEVIKAALEDAERKIKNKETKSQSGNMGGLFNFDSKLAIDSIGSNSNFDKGFGFVIGLLIGKIQRQIDASF